MTHFADRLHAGLKRCGTSLCMGLDPRWESLPTVFRSSFVDSMHGKAEAYLDFCKRVLELAKDKVAVVKPQSAFFEALGPEGMRALLSVCQYAKTLGFLVVLDAKRNDIASTATAYAEMAFEVYQADALTINAYLGADSVEPFLEKARKYHAGLYVLVKTSNKGGGQFQDLVAGGKKVHEHMAEAVSEWTKQNLGSTGYGDVGAVVGATHPQELATLRGLMKDVPFLIPGYGAQGGAVTDIQPAFDSAGLGAIVNSSRGIHFPFKPDEVNWEEAIEKALAKANGELALR